MVDHALGRSANDSTVTFIGNATTIIRYGGFTLLTDPNFLRRGQRAHLGYGLSTRRLRNPAMPIKELPELDGVVLSHLHDDHWDWVAERYLDHTLPVITTRAAARTLHKRGFGSATGLRTWQPQTLTKGDRTVRITAMPGRHAPGPLRHLLPPVMGSMLEFSAVGAEPDLRLYISGDTLMYGGIAEIRRRFPHIDLGLVHLGGTRLLWLVNYPSQVQTVASTCANKGSVNYTTGLISSARSYYDGGALAAVI
jgi:L-ascorbate metabolism protein UlaG (beta-lactamase superfamily)